VAGRLMTEGGVDLRTGVSITGFVEADGPTAVEAELADGSRVRADAAVVGVGGVPRLDWMDGCGIPAADRAAGLPCGPTGRVDGVDAVWAVGDVALWEDPELGGRHRHEHWTSAGDQAAVVARDILGAEPPPPTVPYFWSDQFGLKIQLIGRTEPADSLLPLHGEGLAGGGIRGSVAGFLAGDRLVAVAGFGAARRVARYRALVSAGATRDETLALAATL
jgi:NADPH-dependent 2,4-dienoyl-CoA reductase/sulfur reductase-like enzyme